jgi:hypothetical protein
MDDAEESRMIAGVRAAATRLCAQEEPLTLSVWELHDLGRFLCNVADHLATTTALRISALAALARDLPRSRN